MAKQVNQSASSAPRKSSLGFADSRKGTLAPRIPMLPPFLYAWKADQWSLIGDRVVPRLRTVGLQQAVNQIGKGKDGRFRTAAMRAVLEDRGWIILPQEHGPDGDYLRVVDTQPGGSGDLVESYISAFESVAPGYNKTIPDTEAYCSWLEKLVADGVIPGPPPHVLARMLDGVQDDLLTARLGVEQGRAADIQRLPLLEAQDAALTALVSPQGEPAPEVRTKGRASSKKLTEDAE